MTAFINDGEKMDYNKKHTANWVISLNNDDIFQIISIYRVSLMESFWRGVFHNHEAEKEDGRIFKKKKKIP